MAASSFDVDLSSFGKWNQGLNTSSPLCSFQSGVRYCLKLYLQDPVEEDNDGKSSQSNLPVRDGTTVNCTFLIDVVDGDTCQSVLDEWRLTMDQFYSYNPAIGKDFSNLWTGYQYCVEDPSYVDIVDGDDVDGGERNPTSSSSLSLLSSSTSIGLSPSAPTQKGQPSDCIKRYTAQAGDSCSSVAKDAFITLDQFYSWNPTVSKDCSSGFWGGYAYCIGTPDTASVTRSVTTESPTSTEAVITPKPIQDNNVVSNCNKFATAKSGGYCSLFAENNGISLANLYSWDSVLGSDGSGCSNNFWLGYYYCVGVSK